MGVITMGPDFRLVEFIKQKYHVTNFIETGTYNGNTTESASQFFENVYTIELSPYWYKHTKERLKSKENINFLLGNTKDLLPKVLGKVNNGLLWLDAHWCGDHSFGEGEACPLIEELKIIDFFSKTSANIFILIDDARLFLSPPPLPHPLNEYPDLQTVIAALGQERKVYVFNDIIAAIPKIYQRDFDWLFQSLSTEDLNNLKKSNKSIKQRILGKLKSSLS